MRCLDASDGSLIWSRPTLGFIDQSPAVADGKLFIASMSQIFGMFYCVDTSSGRVMWRHFEFGFWRYYSSPAIANGRVYIGLARGGGVIGHKGTLFCFGE
jgi:outer membrane protein assembly factor BamB